MLGAKLFDRYLRHGGLGRFDHIDLDTFEEDVSGCIVRYND